MAGTPICEPYMRSKACGPKRVMMWSAVNKQQTDQNCLGLIIWAVSVLPTDTSLIILAAAVKDSIKQAIKMRRMLKELIKGLMF